MEVHKPLAWLLRLLEGQKLRLVVRRKNWLTSRRAIWIIYLEIDWRADEPLKRDLGIDWRADEPLETDKPSKVALYSVVKPNAVTDTQYIQQSVHTYYKLLNNQSIIASICPFFVLHQWLLHAKLTKPSEALTRCYVTSHWWWWVGRGRIGENNRDAPSLLTHTLFMSKICDFPYPIYDVTKNLIPCLWPDP